MKTINPVLKGACMLLVLLILCAGFGVYMTHIANSADQIGQATGENFVGNAIKQTLSIIVMFLMGWLLLWPFKNKLGRSQVYLLSYLIGLLTFEMISTFLLIFEIRYTYLAVMAVYTAAVAIVYWQTIARRKPVDQPRLKGDDGWVFAFWLTGTAAVAAVLSFVPINVLSFDSVEYMNLGRMYALKGAIQDYFIYQVSGHPFVPTLINSIAVFFGFDYAYALQNMFLVMSIGLFGYLIHGEITEQGFGKKAVGWLTALATALLAANFFFLYLGVCLVPNMFAAFTLFFAAVYMHRYIRDRETADVFLSFVFMLVFCFSRVEGPLLAVILIAYMSHKGVPMKPLLYYVGGCFLAVGLWYISFYMQSPPDFTGQFLTVGRSLMVTAAFAAVGLYIFLKEKYFSRYNRLLFWLFIGVFLAGALGMSLLDVEKFIGNMTVMYQNMFFYGFWRITWLVILAFSVIALLISKKKDMFLEGMIFILLTFMLLIFAYRVSPLHLYWYDSGNRMLMHLYPFCVFTLALNILSYFAPRAMDNKS